MLRLTADRRAVVADKVPDMANIFAGAIAVGIALGEPPVSWQIVMGTMAIWTGALIFAVVITKATP